MTAAGATLFLLGSRYVPAGVLAFLTLTEVVLAPIWVWAAFHETPSGATLAGGAIVLVALLSEGAARVWQSNQADEAMEAPRAQLPPQSAARFLAYGSPASLMLPIACISVGVVLLSTAITLYLSGL